MAELGLSEEGARDAGEPARRGVRWVAGRTALRTAFEREMEAGRGALWVPVLFGAGILAYFGLPREPNATALFVSLGVTVVLVMVGGARAQAFRLCLAFAAVLAGMATAKLRTDIVTAPILVEEVTSELSGWVESVERIAPGQQRLVVRVAALEGLAPEEMPRRVRITVRGALDVSVGEAIAGLVALQPPPGPAMPGGWDFARDLFYQGIGASGFSYGPPELVDLGPVPWILRWRVPIETLRRTMGERIEAALPGDAGQIANALITGDQSGISDDATEALRLSGLGHILSISGLHMVLVAGAAFWTVRALLALSPALALRRPIKKWAAAGALGVAAGYLILSGAEVATQRAFIMLAVMLAAVLLDRRAISMRNVAVAALIVLLLRPEAVLTASFQMSFAATLALVAGFEVLADRRRARGALGPLPRHTALRVATLWIGGLFLTSLLAALATTPFAAFHFQRTAPLGLVGNLAAMPFVSFLVMPSALVTALLMPFGLEALPLSVMDFGLRQVLAIAREVAKWSGSGGMVPAGPVAALLLISFGLVWLCLWYRRWRLLGLVPMAVGTAVWAAAPQPAILVEPAGTVTAVRASDGAYRVLGEGADFEVDTWLRADADARVAGDPSLAEGVACDRLGCAVLVGERGWVALTQDPRAFGDDCVSAAVVVTPLIAPDNCGGPAIVVDAAMLARTGAVALYETEVGYRVATSRPEQRRPWMPPLEPLQ